jgi:hypothetical protein
MKTKLLLIVYLVISTFIVNAQEKFNTYSFKQQVQHVCNDSVYTKLEIALNKFYIELSKNHSKFIDNNILPLDFLVWKNKSDEIKNFDADDYLCKGLIDKRREKYGFGELRRGSYWDFNFYSKDWLNKTEFCVYTNEYIMSLKRHENSDKSIVYDLNTFSMSKYLYSREKKIGITKTFSSKSRVLATEFLEMYDWDKKYIESIAYYNKSSIILKNKTDESLAFNIKIYEQVERYRYDEVRRTKYEDSFILVAKKIFIKGNKKEAINYLKENKLDHEEISPENIKDDDFKDLE